MGIINVTPDSFSDGGKYLQHEKAIEHAKRLWQEGAEILDFGGESTRPGAKIVDEKEEIDRVIAPIEAIKKEIDAEISIDSRRATVVEKALEAGANWINDISGFEDPKMCYLAAKYDAKCCLMHMKGNPQNMQENPLEEESVVDEVLEFLKKRTENLLKAGLKKDKIYLDPGIGFGKTAEANMALLFAIPKFKKLGFPLLIGLSRKSFLKKHLPLLDPLKASLIMNAFCVHQGVEVLRVHDVAAFLAKT